MFEMDAPEQHARECGSGARRRAEELERRVAEREREVDALRREAESAERKRAIEARRRLSDARPVQSSSNWGSVPIAGAAIAMLRICTASNEPAGTKLRDVPLRLDPPAPVTRLQYDPLPVDYQKQLRKDFAVLTSVPTFGPRLPESAPQNKAMEAAAAREATAPRATAPTPAATTPAIQPSLERGVAHELPRR